MQAVSKLDLPFYQPLIGAAVQFSQLTDAIGSSSGKRVVKIKRAINPGLLRKLLEGKRAANSKLRTASFEDRTHEVGLSTWFRTQKTLLAP
jgi:hypothetical protein